MFEKGQFEEEIKFHNKEMYNLNEQVMIDQFNKEVVAFKQESLAIEKLYMLKDSNVRRRAEIVKLRSRLENLRSDV
jgi:sulfate adenylyltransferase subunit 1 (EFTu-like GTPase family)